MLKAIELAGFKSFADKTRFEFPPGITVIVGPNGSGKSNVVDAIKWVLGEQSAKSLRGKDMADVIFKGTQGAAGRKPAGSASATIILDNSDRRLALDADEVHVTRRVYRSGESEYLLNGESCRLKDIRNLIRGTGLGTDAYSLIEQGKVERLLQASNKDRRAIFEEAAGISRFNAKKVEAQRRLARVEQSLLRLRDIVEEVGSRYRSVKSQASKAARCREYTQRLQQLRTDVGRHDWRQLGRRLETLAAQRAELAAVSEEARSRAEELERRQQEAEAQGAAADQAQAEQQQRSTRVRESIAAVESRLHANEVRGGDLRARVAAIRQTLQRIDAQRSEWDAQRRVNLEQLQRARVEQAAARDELVHWDAALAALEAEIETRRAGLAESQRQREALSQEHLDLGKRLSGLNSQLSAGSETLRHWENERTRLSEAHNRALAETDEHNEAQARLRASAEAIDGDLADARRQWDTRLAEASALQRQLADQRSELSGLTQRGAVLREVEQRLEGIHQGARNLLAEAAARSDPPWHEVLGIVADLVQVNVEHAPLIDAALGERAQHVVVSGSGLLQAVADGRLPISGRVGLVQLESPLPRPAGVDLQLAGHAGVLARADHLVQFAAAHERLVQRLLGTTWIVKSLADALRLQALHGSELRFITVDGDLLEGDGALVLGARLMAVGLVSRRSELRAIERDRQQLAAAIATEEERHAAVERAADEFQQQVQRLLSEHTEISKQLARHEHLADLAQQLAGELQRQLGDTREKLDRMTAHNQELRQQLAGDRQRHDEGERALQALAATIHEHVTALQTLEPRRQEAQLQSTAFKVRLAKAEQRMHSEQSAVDGLEARAAELEQSRLGSRGEAAAALAAWRATRADSRSARRELSTCRAEREALETVLRQLASRREELERQRSEWRQAAVAVRDQWRQTDEAAHQLVLQIEKTQLERQQLADRLREDYGIDLAASQEQAESPSQQAERAEIDREIADLRQKLGNIGPVNMDALAELESLEQRYQTLDAQYRDLVHAKETLEKIIQRINNESRRLFLETLAAIRSNFQQVFRQTFGGGRADILLEEGVDVLEAGVEIVATPPGKPEFNNSLLSGGEKALTAVSLLMAIFKFRPSPFCVLDEVDAPFDEANIGRFIDVLRSFLGWTKFVIVTHSKKTMTAATTLYGVTMQESGISKRVSVRFEDVGEDGEITAPVEETGEPGARRGVA